MQRVSGLQKQALARVNNTCMCALVPSTQQELLCKPWQACCQTFRQHI